MALISVKETPDLSIREDYYTGGTVSAREITWKNESGKRLTEYYKDGKVSRVEELVVHPNGLRVTQLTKFDAKGVGRKIAETRSIGVYVVKCTRESHDDSMTEQHFLRNKKFMEVRHHADGKRAAVFNFDRHGKQHGGQFFYNRKGEFDYVQWPFHGKEIEFENEKRAFGSRRYLLSTLRSDGQPITLRNGPFAEYDDEGTVVKAGFCLANRELSSRETQGARLLMWETNAALLCMTNYILGVGCRTAAPVPAISPR